MTTIANLYAELEEARADVATTHEALLLIPDSGHRQAAYEEALQRWWHLLGKAAAHAITDYRNDRFPVNTDSVRTPVRTEP